MRDYLDEAIKADQYAQFVDDIGKAANDTKHSCVNIETVFECIRNAGLKLSLSKCHFGLKQVNFLGRTITPDGVAPSRQSERLPHKASFSEIKKGVTELYLFFELLSKLHSTPFRTTNPVAKKPQRSMYQQIS